MPDFKIRRGLSTQLFINGQLNPKLVVEEGCWYLCTDTAELFLGGIFEGRLSLKLINKNEADSTLRGELEELEQRLVKLETLESFQKLSSEEDLKNIDFEAKDFNPNVTYYIPVSEGKVNTYIFDKGIPGFVCTNSIDETIVRAMVSDAIDVILDEGIIDNKINEKLPIAIKNVLENDILYGGDATPYN